jgi:hypothetical protein
MIQFDGIKKKNIVFLPETVIQTHYVGKVFGNHFENTGVFNIRKTSPDMEGNEDDAGLIGVICEDNENGGEYQKSEGFLIGKWVNGNLEFFCNDVKYNYQTYNLIQNVFSRNTGILESGEMLKKCAIILGCG